jgi:hypothetical protein
MSKRLQFLGSLEEAMHTRSISLALFLAVVLCVGSALPAWAQGSANTGSVAGAITDQQNAIVVGATVTLTDVGTNIARTSTTNASGRYIFVDVPPGMYRVTVAKQGFATTKAENQEVTVGSALTLNLGLQVGGASVVVEVQSTGSELQTMNATVGQTLTSTALDNLPSIGRDVNTFIELQPAVSTDGSVAGAINDQNYFSLDGGNNTNDMDGMGSVYTGSQVMLSVGDPTGGIAGQQNYSAPTGVMPTPADSVEEFKVNTAGQTADFNSSAGAEIKVVTKRGTNSFHGTAYEYYRDNNWASNTWNNNFENYIPGFHVGLPSYHFSRYGGSLGGPLIPKEVLGGKTYFFFNYEGFNWPDSETIFRNVPSPALQAGLLLDDSATNFGNVDYNLNPTPVTYNGTTYAGSYGCLPGACDPQGIGLNSVVSTIWSKYEPASNAACSQSLCDGANIQGFSANLNLPIKTKFMVGRIDHDFSSKQHFFTSYRYYNVKYAGDDQVDIGGFVTGDTLGVPASQSSNPVQDWYFVAGLTTNISSNVTNDVHYSYLRNWWAWNRYGAPPQVPGMGAAVEIMSGQNETQDLTPINSNNQQIRRRFWDGHDNMIRDDVSMLHGNHLFQVGGYYQHNYDYHQRNDSGGTINAYPVYDLGDGTTGSLLNDTGFLPCTGVGTGTVTSTSIENCGAVAAGVLGTVSLAGQMFARSGASLSLLPPLSNAFDQSTIPYYNVYFSDTWHLKPTMTLTYGLGYALEMPPTEAQGKQTVIVDQSDTPVKALDYIAARNNAALAGNVYNPEIGFALAGNVGSGQKYPYNPYYGEFSPRVAFAWSPTNTAGALANTVVRAGYGRTYGRTNGVQQVLVPLLGLGLEQPIACASNIAGTTGTWNCGASGAATWAAGPDAAFRVNTTASTTGGPTIPLINLATPTLPQPVYPGFNNPASTSPEALDPTNRPDAVDTFNLTIQRQLTRRITLEVGYIGRRITNDFEPIMLNAVPYNMTLGGQSFKNAYATVVQQYCGGLAGLAGGGCGGSALPTPGPGPNPGAVTPQPFFETAMAGTGYCTGFSSCTAAVVANEGATGTGNLVNATVWSLWSDLDGGVGCPGGPGTCTAVNGSSGGAFAFPRTMMNTPIPSTCSTFAGGVGTNGCSGQYTETATLNGPFGHGNYNAGFVSVKSADWRGLTAQANFTWSKALGTGSQVQSSSELDVLDPYNLNEMYGRQTFDRKIIYNSFLVYSPPFYKGQNGLMGRALGGWTFSGVLTAGTGLPIQVVTTTGSYSAFGACYIACGDYDSENGVALPGASVRSHAYACHTGQPFASAPGYYIAACQGQAPGDGYPVNAFSNGALQAQYWRNPILGVDTRDGGYGALNGLNYWNMDFAIKKNIRVAESVSLELQGVFTNVFNHEQQGDAFPGLYNDAGFGALGGQLSNPRQIQIGARVKF